MTKPESSEILEDAIDRYLNDAKTHWLAKTAANEARMFVEKERDGARLTSDEERLIVLGAAVGVYLGRYGCP